MFGVGSFEWVTPPSPASNLSPPNLAFCNTWLCLPLLQSKLASLAAEAQAQKAALTSELSWAGEVYPVREEKVRIPLHAAQVGGGAGRAVARCGTPAQGAGGPRSADAALQLLSRP